MSVIGCMADNGHFCVLILFLGAGYKPVKIALIQLILNDTVLLKLAFGKGFCNGSGDFSLILQNMAFSMTVYKCTEIFDQVVEDFIKTGVMPTFDILWPAGWRPMTARR